jgi:hypothetical protein
MTHLILLPLLLAQTDVPPPPPPSAVPPVIRLEGSTTGAAQPTPAQPIPSPAPAPPPSDAPAVAAPPAAAPPPAPGTRGAPVFLTITSNRPDVLLLKPDSDDPVCTVPCNRLVPAAPSDKYFLGGKGLTNSNDFDLADGIKAARINVFAGTKGGKIAGIILTAVGLPMLLSGALSMVSYGLLSDPAIQARIAAQGGAQQGLSPTVTLVIGLIELIVGAGAGTTGLILWPMNTTRMTVTAVEPPAETSPAPPVVEPPAEQPALAPVPAPATP